MSDLAGVSGAVQEEYVLLLLKVLGVALITKFAIDICNDSGNSALGTAVSLAGKAVILIMCFPLLSTVVELAVGMLK
ncbi:MAG: stage III sporulation AC/AD family protein [Acutalibacteraceae bacterium]|nr:stage III sporulation AC/AD family protein [Acutalibacteraceae bacterium]